MSFADIVSIYAIAAIWGMMLLNVALSIGGFIYIYRCNSTDGSIPLPEGQEYPMVSVPSCRVTEARLLHLLKHHSSITLTLPGMSTDRRLLHS